MKVLDFKNMQTIEEWLKEQETDPDVVAMYEYHHSDKEYNNNIIMEERSRMTCSQRRRERI